VVIALGLHLWQTNEIKKENAELRNEQKAFPQEHGGGGTSSARMLARIYYIRQAWGDWPGRPPRSPGRSGLAIRGELGPA